MEQHYLNLSDQINRPILAALYDELVLSGELALLCTPLTKTFGDFMVAFDQAVFAVGTVQHGKLNWMCLVRPNSVFPSDEAVWLMGWSSKQHRATRDHARKFYRFLKSVFSTKQTILTITHQEALLRSHLDWGFKFLCTLPPANGLAKSFLLYLSEQQLENSRLARLGR